ncbi:MAG: Xaa-Pro peptidase family protein [Bryobacteraceae bacterium]|nr:Xaa-Pro peptidase family protein [Bryobacteraceae bacterium]
MNSRIARRTLLQGLAVGVPATFAAAAMELPQPIAALKSRAAEAMPITPAERKERIERAQTRMQAQKIDAICIAGGTSLSYFGGVRWGNSERLLAMIVPAKGDPFFVVPAFEEGRAREQINLGFPGERFAVYAWEEDESPYGKIAAGLKERGVTAGTVGVEETMPFVFSDGIGKALPAAKIAPATPIVAGCRMIKTKHEIDLMKLANEVTLAAYAAASPLIQVGMKQDEIAALIASAHQQLGFRGGAMVLVNEGSALPHGTVQPQVVRENSIVLMDGGCRVEGYESDITRTIVVGQATDKMKRVFEIVHAAQAEALKTARPGVACEAVDRAARKVIEDGGYGPGYKYFTHRLGHGIGLDGHEWTYLRKGNRTPIEAGMCFSDEPGIYIPGEFGIRLEDCMYVTSAGARMFTPPSPSLEHPFATT